jgi:hypothetical protein
MTSPDAWISIVHRYYPIGLLISDPGYAQSEQHRSLVAARLAAGDNRAPWIDMLERMGAQFPNESMSDKSVRLKTGRHDACYAGAIHLPPYPGEHHRCIGFMFSILVPCFVVYGSRIVDDPTPLAIVPRRQIMSLELAQDELPIGAWIAREAEGRLEFMPEAIGRMIVPDVETAYKELGEATIYDCLLSSDW